MKFSFCFYTVPIYRGGFLIKPGDHWNEKLRKTETSQKLSTAEKLTLRSFIFLYLKEIFKPY